jgi:hypothetical protein
MEEDEITIETLQQIIGQKDIGLFLEIKKNKELIDKSIMLAQQFQNVMTEVKLLREKTAKPIAADPEIERLKQISASKDQQIKQLETQVHNVGLEKEAIKNENLKISKDYADKLALLNTDNKKANEAFIKVKTDFEASNLELETLKKDFLTLQTMSDDLQKQLDAKTKKKVK